MVSENLISPDTLPAWIERERSMNWEKYIRIPNAPGKKQLIELLSCKYVLSFKKKEKINSKGETMVPESEATGAEAVAGVSRWPESNTINLESGGASSHSRLFSGLEMYWNLCCLIYNMHGSHDPFIYPMLILMERECLYLLFHGCLSHHCVLEEDNLLSSFTDSLMRRNFALGWIILSKLNKSRH